VEELYRFGPFELDPKSLELKREGVGVPLQPKVMDLLLLLVRSGGEVLSREALQAELWPDVVVTEQSLRQLLYRLREVLGDHADAVKTMPGRGLRWEPPASEPVEPAAEALPAERDAFVGRAADLAALQQALQQARLVTVLGTGGVGKTRLVLRFCHLERQRWPGGCWFCDLSEARSALELAQVVGEALGEALGGEPMARLGKALRGRGRALMVLDNFEQLVEHAETAVGGWLEAAPELSLVVTSRQLLRVRGERVLELPPMTPQDGAALFRLRVEASGRELPLDELEVVEELVRRLDGLPLALELAAARARLLSLPQLLQRWQGGTHALRDTLDWSWALLTPEEQQALAQLSVFAGGFGVEAAEAVLGELSEALFGLLDKSWVHRVGPERFDLLVSLREYATEKLSEPETAHRRHGAWFARRVDRGTLALAPELANLRVACERALSRGDAEVAEATAQGVWRLTYLTGPHELAAELFERALQLEGLSSAQRGRLHMGAGQARRWQLRMGEARAHLQAALDLARAEGDEPACARVLLHLAAANHPQAAALGQEALVLARKHALPQVEAGVEYNAGTLCRGQGDLEAATAHLERAASLYRSLQDPVTASRVLVELADIDSDQGRFAQARERYEEVLRATRAQGDGRGEVMLLFRLLVLEVRSGTAPSMRQAAEQALQRARQASQPLWEAAVLRSLALQQLWEGELSEAGALCEQAALVLDEVDSAEGRLEQLFLQADLAHARGQEELARELAREVQALGREIDVRFVALSLRLLGEIEQDVGQLAEAAARFRALGDPREEGQTLGALARVQASGGALAEADEGVSRALEMLRRCGAQRALAEVLCVRAELDLRLGRPDAAVTAWTEASALARGLGVGPASGLQRELAQLQARSGERLGQS
jgi:predicted ATPase